MEGDIHLAREDELQAGRRLADAREISPFFMRAYLTEGTQALDLVPIEGREHLLAALLGNGACAFRHGLSMGLSNGILKRGLKRASRWRPYAKLRAATRPISPTSP